MYLPHAMKAIVQARYLVSHISAGAFHARWRRRWTCLSAWTFGRSTLCNRLKLCSLITETIVSSHPSESHLLEQAKVILLSRFFTATIPNTKLHKNISAQGVCDGCTSQTWASWSSSPRFYLPNTHESQPLILISKLIQKVFMEHMRSAYWGITVDGCRYRYASTEMLRVQNSDQAGQMDQRWGVIVVSQVHCLHVFCTFARDYTQTINPSLFST